MIFKIYKDLDPVLRKPTEPVGDFGHEFQILVDNMIETMRKNKGIGLAAPQIGISKKIFVAEFSGDPELELKEFPLTVICNPEIVKSSEKKKKMVEGCLSFPGLEFLIERPENIVMRGQDRFGKDIEIKADSLYARVLQHEFDHLNSTLMVDHLKEIETIFIGTGTMGVRALKLMAHDPQYHIAVVVTTSEKEIIGRAKDKAKNPILEAANKLNLPVIKTKNIKTDREVIEKLKSIKPDLGVVSDFGQIIPKEIIDIPKHGILNIHPSLLPKHRGSSPIQSTILSGDPQTGVTVMKIDEKMDAGDIISQVRVEPSPSETATTLKNYLAEVGAALLLNSIPYYISGDLKPRPQNHDDATFTKMIEKQDGLIDSTTDKVVVDRKIRAFNEWPNAFMIVKKKRVTLLSGHFEEDGEFKIDRVKPEGKKEMSYEDFVRGYKTKLTFR